MLHIRPLYRVAVRNATRYKCVACVSQRGPQRQLHATPRMRKDRLPPPLASNDDNCRATSMNGDAKHGLANDDDGGGSSSEGSVHTTSESGSRSGESTTTHESPATTMIEAPAAALARLTTLARPWTPIAGKLPQEAAGGSTSTSTSTTTSIDKTFRFDTFEDAFMFMTRIAFYASQVNHHPRMFNFWNQVRLTLSSYDSVRKTRVVSLADVEMGVFAEKVYESVVDRRRQSDEREAGASVGPDDGSGSGNGNGNGQTTKLSDILAEELIRRGSDSYAMLNNTHVQGQKSQKKAMLDGLKSIKRRDKKKE
ncbi:hypothetical protein V1517DRAFT_322146 [Lipomyces orientalis]|uniref:Uncharacterized protein n=1 Tax=Lipomyces orientalis TaxID=1233043 RepID=A0ACC3TP90_9ASCO